MTETPLQRLARQWASEIGRMTIKPALTPEEWEVHGDQAMVTEHWCEMVLRGRKTTWEERTHALAALCLHGQSFGFTREGDVKLLQGILWHLTATNQLTPEARRHLAHLTDRIEALLPPEKP